MQTKPLTYLLFLLLISGYLGHYLTGDLLVSYGAAHQASLLEGNFVEKLLSSWNLRGFGYKFILYLNYSLIHPVVDLFQNPVGFAIIYKIFHLLFFFGVLLLSYQLAKAQLIKLQLNIKMLLAAIILGFLSSNFMMIGQPEEYGFIFMLLLLGIWLSPNKTINFFGGLLIPILFSLKATTLAFAAFPILFVWIFRNSLNFKVIIIGLIVNSLVGFVLYYYFLNPDLIDLKNAMKFQASSGFSGILSFNSVYKGINYLLAYQPFICVAFYAFPLVFIFGLKSAKTRFYLVLAFLIGITAINVQGKYFHYHFLNLLPVAVLVFYYIYNAAIHIKFFKLISVLGILILLLGYTKFFFHTIHTYPKWATPASGVHNYTYNLKERKLIATKTTEIIGNHIDTILYLTDGGINYYLPNPTYSRYFYPLPVQRAMGYRNLKETEIYSEMHQSIINFPGTFILIQPNWFYLDRFEEIEHFITTNFDEVYRYKGFNQMVLYQRKS